MLQAGDELLRRAVFDEFGQLAHERDRAVALGARGGPEREQLLELVEDQHGHDGAATGVDQPVVAVMEKLPERFTRLGGAGFRPRAGARGRVGDHGLHLFARSGRAVAVIEPEVDRAEVGRAQPREDAGHEERRLAEAGLPEEHGERLALHEPGERANLGVAAVEEAALIFGERGEVGPGRIRVGCRRGTSNVAGFAGTSNAQL